MTNRVIVIVRHYAVQVGGASLCLCLTVAACSLVGNCFKFYGFKRKLG